MAESKSARLPLQPDGMPQGKHLSGFKGSKVDGECFCGRCHPNAVANRDHPLVVVTGVSRG